MSSESDTIQIKQSFIRPMLPSDLDAVILVEEQSFAHPWTREQFMAELERDAVSRCHVAVMGDDKSGLAPDATSNRGPVAGFIMTWVVADELHIINLAVVSHVRRSGLAAALLEHSIREATEQGVVWCQLDVRASNTPARKLYSRFGFKPLGTRKGYYQNGEDAVVMGKELKNSV